MSQLPETGFLREKQILGCKGNSNANPPRPAIPAIIPVSHTSWWNGIKAGKFPKPVKLGPRTSAWRVEDIKALGRVHSNQI